MHLRRVSHTDVPTFAAAAASAMWDDEVMAYVAPYKDNYPLSFSRFCLHRIAKRFYSGQFLFLVVSDPSDSSWTGTTDEVVLGYAAYSTTVKDVIKPCPGGWLGNTFERRALDLWAQYSSFCRLDQSADPGAERHFRRLCEIDMFDKYLDTLPATHKEVKGDQHWELESLGTLPQFRRRGVAKMALSWGFERAEETGVPLVVFSSVMGEKLYTAAGFKVVERLNMLPQTEEDAALMGKTTRERMAKEDYGLGPGKGIEWSAMVWEPDEMRQNDRAGETGVAEGI